MQNATDTSESTDNPESTDTFESTDNPESTETGTSSKGQWGQSQIFRLARAIKCPLSEKWEL